MFAASTPAGRTDWPDLLVIGAGAIAIAQGLASSALELILCGAVVCCAGCLGRKRDAWTAWIYSGAAATLLLLSAWLYRAAATFGPIESLILFAGVALAGIAAVKFMRVRAALQTAASPVSLVLLDQSPRFIDAHILACIIDGAWGTDLSNAGPDAEEFVVGEAPTFVVKTKTGAFFVHAFSQPYWDSPDEVSSYLSDVRAQNAVRDHQAWVSVDAMDDPIGEARELAYRQISLLIAELARADTRALLHPESGSFRVWDDSAGEALRSSSPQDWFDAGNSAAVVQVSTDDPMMEAAIEEARRRWPEFVTAFARRHPEQHFSVKAPVTREGYTEHIWIEVTALNQEQVKGRLGNDPINLGDLKLGAAIAVPTSSVEDWLYVLTNEPVGGFTIPAAASAPRRSRRSV